MLSFRTLEFCESDNVVKHLDISNQGKKFHATTKLSIEIVNYIVVIIGLMNHFILGVNKDSRSNGCIVHENDLRDLSWQELFRTSNDLYVCRSWTYWNSLMFSFTATTTIGFCFFNTTNIFKINIEIYSLFLIH